MSHIEIDKRGCQAYFCRFYLCSLCCSTTKQPSSHLRRTRLWLHLCLIADGWDMGKTVWGVPAWHSSESITKTTPGKQWLGLSRCPRLNNTERHQTPDKGTFQINLLDIKHGLHIFLFDFFFLFSSVQRRDQLQKTTKGCDMRSHTKRDPLHNILAPFFSWVVCPPFAEVYTFYVPTNMQLHFIRNLQRELYIVLHGITQGQQLHLICMCIENLHACQIEVAGCCSPTYINDSECNHNRINPKP